MTDLSCACLERIVASDPVFNGEDYYFNTDDEEFSRAMETTVAIVKLMKKHNQPRERAYLNR